MWQKKKKITNQNVQRSSERVRIKRELTLVLMHGFTVHTHTQTNSHGTHDLYSYVFFWSWDASKFHPLVFHLLQTRFDSEFMAFLNSSCMFFHNCTEIMIHVFFYVFCLIRNNSAVCPNLLGLDSCFVSVHGGSVTLAQPCHRTACCHCLK